METNIATLRSVYFYRGDIVPFQVEATVTPGIGIHLVGIPDASVKEGLLRIVTAIQASGFPFPGKKVVVTVKPLIGVTPWNRCFRPRECSSAFDLPIALSVLMAAGKIPNVSDKMNGFVFFAKLGLDGALKAPYTGIDDNSAASVLSWKLRQDCIIGYPASVVNRSMFVDKYKTLSDVIEAIINGEEL